MTAFLAFFACAILLQWRAGAFIAEFSGPDEAAHFVTSLMVHDYVASGMPAAPVKFAENYYVRYPKVAFGIWPPLFHLSQAAWMLAFSPTRVSVIVLMAFWTALLATVCFYAVQTEFGTPAAACLGAVLVFLPEVQTAANTDMPDLMMSCFIFAATLFFGSYLDRQRTRDALMFGLLAGIAILVKYNALALALVPPFALLFSRRFDLLRRPSFWLPAGIVAMICGPWYMFNRNLVRYAMEPDPGIAAIPAAMRANLGALAALLGMPLLAVAMVGALAALRPGSSERAVAGKWTAATALLAALWFFHSVLYPISESRYLLAAAPALLLFVAAGLRVIAAWLSWRTTLRYATCFAVIVCGCLLYGLSTFRIAGKKHHGLSELAAVLSSQPRDTGQFILVSGSAQTEGMMVSEMALLDRQQRYGVLRASKVLARVSWMDEHYEALYHKADEMVRFLSETPVSIVAVEQSQDYSKPHHRLLQEVLASRPDLWAPVKMGNAENIEVYVRRGPHAMTHSAVTVVDLSRTLGRSLVVPRAIPPRSSSR